MEYCSSRPSLKSIHSTIPEYEASTSLNNLKNIDLEVLMYLRRNLQIGSVEELVRISVNKFYFCLEDARKEYSMRQDESWIEQAKEMISEINSWKTSVKFVVCLQKRCAGKQVERRTTLHFFEADGSVAWPDIEFSCYNNLTRKHLEEIKSQSCQGPTTTAINRRSSGTAAKEFILEDDLCYSKDLFEDFNLKEITEKINALEAISHSEHAQFIAIELVDDEASESPSEDDTEILPEELPDPSPDEQPHRYDNSENLESISEDELVLNESDQAVTNEGTSSDSDSLRENEDSAEPIKLNIIQVKFFLSSEPHRKLEERQFEDTEGKIQKAEKALSKEEVKEEIEERHEIIFNATKRVFPDALSKENPFDAEVTFKITGMGALKLTQQPLLYHTEVYGENRTTRQKLTLGHAPVGHLVDGQLTYTCRLTGVSLSKAGTYRLQIVTHLEDAPVSPDLLELPFVQVA